MEVAPEWAWEEPLVSAPSPAGPEGETRGCDELQNTTQRGPQPSALASQPSAARAAYMGGKMKERKGREEEKKEGGKREKRKRKTNKTFGIVLTNAGQTKLGCG